GEVSPDVGFGCGPSQVAYEQFVFHVFALFSYLRRIARFRPSDFDLPSLRPSTHRILAGSAPWFGYFQELNLSCH
ncbi:MAG: hypothetical protein ACKOIB_02760, partial [Verrucomicrobiota bacterium]